MHFTKNDLQQLTADYVGKLSPERRAALCHELRTDLMRAHEQLEQNPANSSRPSSSQALWERSSSKEKTSPDDVPEKKKDEPEEEDHEDKDSTPSKASSEALPHPPPEQKRKAGKQPGAPGYGRTQQFTEVKQEEHRPVCCKGCGHTFSSETSFRAEIGFHVIDIAPAEPGKIGITGTCVKHLYGSSSCVCGFSSATKPHECPPEKGWSVDMGEWRLVGPTLMAFLVFAKLRLHLTISKTQLLLGQWLGIKLSRGVISKVLLEAGRAVSDLEPTLVEALIAAKLLHMDETSWLERGECRWLWVGTSQDTTAYIVGSRTKEVALTLLESFSGTLMTDGYAAYRSYKDRVRCWAHLTRKAKGLADSWDQETASFGRFAASSFKDMQDQVYQMRQQPEARGALTKNAIHLRNALTRQVLRQVTSTNEPIRKFCQELVNDFSAIFRVLEEPELPLTNNCAERALRSLVLLRKICYGSKTAEGSHTVALLASVWDTLTLRKVEAHPFLCRLFAKRRMGSPSPALPSAPS